MQGSRTRGSATKNRILRKMLAQMAEIEREAVCARIARARKEAGLTQPEVADLLGLSLRSYQDYESFRVPFRRLDQIADILGTTKRWLLYGDNPAPAIAAAETESELLEAIRQLTEEMRLFRRHDDEAGGSGAS